MPRDIIHPLIEDYLDKLNKGLKNLPNSERRQYIFEVRDHIYNQLSEKINQGMNIDQAVQNTLCEFLPPNQLAKEILQESQGDDGFFSNRGDIFFHYGLIATVGSFGGLSIPVYKGELNVGVILPFIISLIIGILLLNSKVITLNERQLKNLKWVSRILIGFLSVPLSFFSIRIIKDNSINFFSLNYLIILILADLLVYMFLRKLFYRQQLENY
jgi:hypothetical protein